MELPIDACQVACSAGASYVTRISSYNKKLSEEIARAIEFKGFSVLDIWGVCTGRYSKRNQLNPKIIDEELASLSVVRGPVDANFREEYGTNYRKLAAEQKAAATPASIEAKFSAPCDKRQEVILLGEQGSESSLLVRFFALLE